MRYRRRGAAPDVAKLRESIKGAGIDTRYWCSYGTVATVGDDGQENFTNPHAVHVAPDGVYCDVVLQPSLMAVTCRYPGMAGGGGIQVISPVHPGDEVLVVLPDGVPSGPPVIVTVLHSQYSQVPLGTDRKPLAQNDRVLVYAGSVPIDLRTAGGGRVQINQDGTVVLDEGTRGVARLQDTTKLTMTPQDILALAAQLLATGLFLTPGTPPTPPAPVVFTSGEITSASSRVKAG